MFPHGPHCRPDWSEPWYITSGEYISASLLKYRIRGLSSDQIEYQAEDQQDGNSVWTCEEVICIEPVNKYTLNN